MISENHLLVTKSVLITQKRQKMNKEKRKRMKGEAEVRQREKAGITTRRLGRAVDIQLAGGVCTLTAGEPAQLPVRHGCTGTAPVFISLYLVLVSAKTP